MAYQPKSYRKFIATAATATIVASAVAPAASAASVSDFKDVAPKYLDAVSYLVANGITQGTTDTTFGTHDNVKRGDAAIWLAKALKLDLTNVPASGFTDTGRYDAAVSALKSEGVLSGKTATTFAPNALLTRGEMAKILANAYELTSDTDVPFTDLGPNFGPYIKALYEYEVTQGKTATTFGTSMNITRGDLAIFLKRAAEVVKTPEVSSVTAVNAKQLEVKFNTAVDEDSVLDSNGELLKSVFTIKSLDGKAVTVDDSLATAATATGELSEDGKTLTITAAGTEVFDKRYDVTVNGARTTSGVAVPKFFATISASDTVAPALVSVTKTNASTVVVKFSEPVLSVGTPVFKLADGSTVSNISGSLANNNTEYRINLSNSTIPSSKDITATFVGVRDFAGNLTAQNPFTTTFQKGDKDGVKPTVTSVTVVNGGKLEVKFSEALVSAPTVAVGTNVATVTKDSSDATKYYATFSTPLSNLQKVDVSNFTDLSGEAGDNYAKLVNFSVDTTGPKVASTNLVTDSKDGKQYLEVKFDEDVVFNATNTISVTGSYVKDYVTQTLSSKAVTASDFVAVGSSKNTYRIAASKLFATGQDFEGASYSLRVSGTSALVEDLSGNDGSTYFTASFTRGKDGSAPSTAKPVVSSVAQNPADNSKVTVVFDKEVDGASATTVSNYQIDGTVVEKATLSPYNSTAGTQTVTLTLKDNSNTFNGARYVTVSGVKAKNGTLMDVYKEIISLKENVAPLVKDAKLTTTTSITVSFTEAVSNGAGNDFELYIGGTKATNTLTLEGVAADSEKSSLVLTLGTALTAEDVSKGIALKAVSTIDVKDAAGNVVDVPSAGVAVQ
ncbi:S-layer homology domain-containing protein [Bacillus infantis]|uniref:S-layer homology domain-containing protein n=1 Tax=Bacillus infantis TaxID=324767 RepID=UPI003015B585